MSERELREQMVRLARSMFERGLTAGNSGNLSARLPDGMLITPTNSCLGRLDPDRIAKLDSSGKWVAGDKPSKEAFLHQSMYHCRPAERAIVHLHSTHSVAVSCLADVDPANVLPPITAYYVMRVGSLPLVPYFPPGDRKLAEAIEQAAKSAHAVLLSNHGPLVSAGSLEAAVDAMEELEATAKLYLMLRNERINCLSPDQVRELAERFPHQ
ncbi:aldolase [Roseiconus nitratireducens]|uniref:3-oxo-tetronate 4-phosphate decarboxylase n=1 Tax=Roseiconus nitratireducens TaxID=2605748 RepID=A0A5M6D2P3_9BACT|nr:3-oxo-tetronate 4-phosphate decarboxylase [Roseiconus nitratireducens]KAA5541758.1 aldolase [Roseiconus nitratireducens]